MMRITLTILLVTHITTHAYDQSLADCKAVAAKFRNTCVHGSYDTPASAVDKMASEKFECPDKPKCIPSGVLVGTTCTWERRLCITCRVDSGVTKIRIQTNNLPDHCVQSPSIKAQNFDYEVTFNPKKAHGDGKWLLSLTTEAALKNAVCRISKGYDAKDKGIVEYGTAESANAMGFALNGVAFQFANQIKEDPVYPITEVNEQPLDLCLGHNQRNSPSGMYHYHDISPCINNKFMSGKTMSSCEDHAECKKDITAWALSGYADMKTKTVIGIGKDGHVLYGPYDSAGKLWQTKNVDACNGAWSADLKDYFYVGTRWHPYVCGCLGPSNFPQNDVPPLYAKCSVNGMEKYAASATDTTTSADTLTSTAATTPATTTTTVLAAVVAVLISSVGIAMPF